VANSTVHTTKNSLTPDHSVEYANSEVVKPSRLRGLEPFGPTTGDCQPSPEAARSHRVAREEVVLVRALDLIAGTEIVPETVCWEMLASQSIGRVVFCHEGRVEIFPVNYALHENQILFATNHGRKLTGVAHGEIAFEVD